MVRIGNKEVIFSASFVMGKDFDDAVTFSVPSHPFLEYSIKVQDRPHDATNFSAGSWWDVKVTEERTVISVDIVPQGGISFNSLGVGMANQGFDVQVVRQGVAGRMLVQVIIVREPR